METEISSNPPKSVWNSLEVAKLLATLFVAIAVIYTGQKLKDTADQAAAIRMRRQLIADKRIALWNEIGPRINRIYCYFLYVGTWKETSPEDIIKTKRDLDNLIFSDEMFFTQDFFKAYQAFMKEAFGPFKRWGDDASLKTMPIRPKDKGQESKFENCDNGEAVFNAYWNLQDQAAKQFELPDIHRPPKPDVPPNYGIVGTCK